jgi:hypothetical protein
MFCTKRPTFGTCPEYNPNAFVQECPTFQALSRYTDSLFRYIEDY